MNVEVMQSIATIAQHFKLDQSHLEAEVAATELRIRKQHPEQKFQNELVERMHELVQSLAVAVESGLEDDVKVTDNVCGHTCVLHMPWGSVEGDTMAFEDLLLLASLYRKEGYARSRLTKVGATHDPKPIDRVARRVAPEE